MGVTIELMSRQKEAAQKRGKLKVREKREKGEELFRWSGENSTVKGSKQCSTVNNCFGKRGVARMEHFPFARVLVDDI